MAQDMFKTHSNLNASPDRSHYLRALVIEGGRMKESVTRSTGGPVLKEMGTIGGLLDIGEKKKWMNGKRAGCCRNRTPNVLQSPHSAAEHDRL